MVKTKKQYKHLVNTRLSFAKNSAGVLDIVDKNDYYPFGMNHLDANAGSFFGQSSYKNYKFGGKELQETGMYDYGARMYMADIGRWGVMDALSEQYRRHSPYNYAINNPIRFIDPDGNSVETFTGEAAQQAFMSIRNSMSATSDGNENFCYMSGFGNDPNPTPNFWQRTGDWIRNLFGGKKKGSNSVVAGELTGSVEL